MRRGWTWLLALALLFSCTACGQGETAQSGGYALYYLTQTELAAGGDALAPEYCALELPDEAVEAATLLLERYMRGPESETLTSPLPASLQLLGVSADGSHVYVDVSSSYGMLSGVDLTLADSCLTLTLTQLSSIAAVTVTVNGRTLEYRNIQTLRERNILMGSTEDLIATVSARLYFLSKATGQLTAEDWEIPVYEGETRVENVLAALLSGPESGELLGVFPADYSVPSVWVEADTCYVNLSSDLLGLFANGAESTALQAITLSLRSVEGVRLVQFLVDGSLAARYGTAEIGAPIPVDAD